MKIIHRVAIASSPQVRMELADIGIAIKSDEPVSFDIEEQDDRWPRVLEWVVEREAFDTVRTDFSPGEVSDAPWLQLIADGHVGYPQPARTPTDYLAATYDLTGYCSTCGVGLRQVRPFRLKAEPKWGLQAILQLNWVFDEFFVFPQVWREVFEPRGIACQPVIDTRGRTLKTVVQLVARPSVHLLAQNLEGEKCTACKRTKYFPVARGPLPTPAESPQQAYVKSAEYFGYTGPSAHQAILISQDLARALAAMGVRGASVRPIAARS